MPLCFLRKGKEKTRVITLYNPIYQFDKYLITMLFSAGCAYGILSAEAGIANSQMMLCLIVIVQVFASQRNTSALPTMETISQAQFEYICGNE
jgi:hypothetical protein